MCRHCSPFLTRKSPAINALPHAILLMPHASHTCHASQASHDARISHASHASRLVTRCTPHVSCFTQPATHLSPLTSRAPRTPHILPPASQLPNSASYVLHSATRLGHPASCLPPRATHVPPPASHLPPPASHLPPPASHLPPAIGCTSPHASQPLPRPVRFPSHAFHCRSRLTPFPLPCPLRSIIIPTLQTILQTILTPQRKRYRTDDHCPLSRSLHTGAHTKSTSDACGYGMEIHRQAAGGTARQ